MPATATIPAAKIRWTTHVSPLYLTIGILLATSLAFMAIQNTTHTVGGHISLPKALWLDWTLTTFYVVPFFLWRNSALSPAIRSLFGWLLLSFFLRGIAELIVIYATHDWRCVYGISHNALTLALAAFLYFRLPSDLSATGRTSSGFLLIYVATLVFETVNAWQFSLLADPASGVYFAADTPHFAFVNRLTWVELACLWPWFCWLLWKTRTDLSCT
jgi:hypothetical protein